LPHQLRQALRERIVYFLENLAGGRERIGERLAHADRLAALTGKNECAHHGARDKSRAQGQVKRQSRWPEPERRLAQQEGPAMKIFLRVVLVIVAVLIAAAAAIYFTGNTITVMAI